MDISQEKFEELINIGLDQLPKQYIERLNNVAIVTEDEPTPEQREKLKLRCDQTLLGLYEGIPLTQRNSGYNLVLPDKITLFKGPLLAVSNSPEQLAGQIKHTLWHEIAHYFGLNHDRIHKLEQGFRP